MSKILVTGGAGFIGSHIADAYIANGHTVCIVDNMDHGFKRNVPKLATFRKADIRDAKALKRIFTQFQPDVVNHHAAIASVVSSVDDPTITHEVNVIGTIRLLETAVQFGAKRFIFASTGGAMYGDDATLPVKDGSAQRPESPYGLSKQLAEDAVRYYTNNSTLKHVIFRYANVYGERQDPNGEAGVCAIFSQLLNEGAQPKIFGDGSKTRDYVYIKDIVRANMSALRRGTNRTMNLGTGTQISDRDVFEEIAQYFDNAQKPLLAPSRAGELQHSALDASVAQEVLGWKPKYSFAAGINEYINSVYA